MYRPQHFEVEDRQTIYGLMRDWSFAVLVSQVDDRPFATHLPLHLDDADPDAPRLLGHMARPNPHWRSFDGETEALAVFQGPHTYVSPNWYANENLVPTWNYAAVHVGGRPRLIEAPAEMRAVLERLTGTYESDATGNWSMDRLDDDLIRRQMGGIAVFELPIERLEAKWKMSQNRRPEDRAGVVEALRGQGDEMSTAVASEIEKANDRS